MYRDITFAPGVTLACVAAGPVFLASVVLFTATASPQPIPVDASAAAFMPLAIPAILVGGLVALLPNLVGTAVLARLASGNVGLRLPAAWGLIGGLLAGCAASFGDGEAATTAGFAATGAICALLCRRGTRWPD